MHVYLNAAHVCAHHVHRYSNEAERGNLDIYDDSKLKKTLWLRFFLQINSAL